MLIEVIKVKILPLMLEIFKIFKGCLVFRKYLVYIKLISLKLVESYLH